MLDYRPSKARQTNGEQYRVRVNRKGTQLGVYYHCPICKAGWGTEKKRDKCAKEHEQK